LGEQRIAGLAAAGAGVGKNNDDSDEHDNHRRHRNQCHGQRYATPASGDGIAGQLHAAPDRADAAAGTGEARIPTGSRRRSAGGKPTLTSNDGNFKFSISGRSHTDYATYFGLPRENCR